MRIVWITLISSVFANIRDKQLLEQVIECICFFIESEMVFEIILQTTRALPQLYLTFFSQNKIQSIIFSDHIKFIYENLNQKWRHILLFYSQVHKIVQIQSVLHISIFYKEILFANLNHKVHIVR